MVGRDTGFFERVWRERCGYAAIVDEALTEAEILEACGEVPVLLVPESWGRDPALRDLVFAAASALLYRQRFGDASCAVAIANHPVLARAVAAVPDEYAEREAAD